MSFSRQSERVREKQRLREREGDTERERKKCIQIEPSPSYHIQLECDYKLFPYHEIIKWFKAFFFFVIKTTHCFKSFKLFYDSKPMTLF